MIFKYYINLDERGDFNADVRDPEGVTIYEIHGGDHLWEMIEDGYMENKRDLSGLQDYLVGMLMMGDDDRLVSGC